MPSHLRFAAISEIDLGEEWVFGGKAHGLARLLRSGARVPEAFAVEATVLPLSDWAEADREELRARSVLLLKQGPVAVRSSAVGEDSADRSFAGLFETVLGVGTPEAVLAAADRCIASGRAERVRAYSRKAEPPPVGLLIQHQVEARAAGVCLTRDPAGHDHALLVEAVRGTGDTLVSGRAEPERWRVYRSGLGIWEVRPAAVGAAQVLSHCEAEAVASEAAGLAGRLGHPLDLEWAFGQDALWWLQARPITAAQPIQEWVIERFTAGAQDGPVTVWANFNVRETMPYPLPPLGWTLWRDVILPTVMEPLFGISRRSPLLRHVGGIDLVHGRLYWNMNALLAIPLLGAIFSRMIRFLDARAAQTVESLLASGVLTRRQLPGGQTLFRLRTLAAAARSAAGLLLAAPPRRVLRQLEACAARIAARPNVRTLTDLDLTEEMRLLGHRETAPLHRGQQAMVVGFIFLAAADRAFSFDPRAQRLLTAGVRGNPTTEISIRIDALVESARPLASLFEPSATTEGLAAALRSDPQGRAWWRRLEAFLSEFGHRGPGEFDLTVPRWSEDPSMILGLVRASLGAPPAEAVASRLDRLAEERRVAVADAVRKASWWKRPGLLALARLVESYMPLREAPKHYGMVVFERMRQAILELGNRLKLRGVIDNRNDVFLLEWEEVSRLAQGEPPGTDFDRRIADRRHRFARFRRERAPEYLRSDGVPLGDAPASALEPGVLRGTAISGGTAAGRARLLTSPDASALQPGDVLVVELADPGWTPLFPRASAVVMEVGGLSCHAAVIARELGIPAVFGVRGATALLRSGQWVTVNGTDGTVRVETR